MAKMIDDIRERLLDHVLSLEEIDSVLEENKYLPIETDEDDIDTLKYSNNKSQIYGHTDTETTKRYIGVMREKARKCFNSVAQRIEDIDNGVKSAIDNAPVIAMKTNDLRDILLEAIKSGRETNAEVDADTLKDLLSKVESIRIS